MRFSTAHLAAGLRTNDKTSFASNQYLLSIFIPSTLLIPTASILLSAFGVGFALFTASLLPQYLSQAADVQALRIPGATVDIIKSAARVGAIELAILFAINLLAATPLTLALLYAGLPILGGFALGQIAWRPAIALTILVFFSGVLWPDGLSTHLLQWGWFVFFSVLTASCVARLWLGPARRRGAPGHHFAALRQRLPSAESPARGSVRKPRHVLQTMLGGYWRPFSLTPIGWIGAALTVVALAVLLLEFGVPINRWLSASPDRATSMLYFGPALVLAAICYYPTALRRCAIHAKADSALVRHLPGMPRGPAMVSALLTAALYRPLTIAFALMALVVTLLVMSGSSIGFVVMALSIMATIIAAFLAATLRSLARAAPMKGSEVLIQTAYIFGQIALVSAADGKAHAGHSPGLIIPLICAAISLVAIALYGRLAYRDYKRLFADTPPILSSI